MNHFERYNEVLNMIKEIEYKLMVINNNLIGLKGVSFSDMPKVKGYEDKRLDYITEKDDLEERLKDLYKEKDELYDKHLKEIAKVSDERYRSILRSVYLLRLSYEDIEKLMNLSNASVKKLRRQAWYEFKQANEIV